MAINSWTSPKVTDKISECIPFLQKALTAVLKMEPASISDIPTGAKRMVLPNSSQWKIEKYDGTNWVAAGKLMHDVDKVDGYHAAITPAKNTIAVRNADGVLQDSITGNAATATKAVALSEINPVSMGGTGSNTAAGARTNLGVPPIAHASTANTYGLGSDTNYGHVKLSDAVDGTEAVANGTAATPNAVKAVNDAAVHKTGNETIAGAKTFTASPTVHRNTPAIRLKEDNFVVGELPSANQYWNVGFYDKNDVLSGRVLHYVNATGDSAVCLENVGADGTTRSIVSATVSKDNIPYATAPTPKDSSGNVNTSDNSTKIATTQWVTTKINNDVPPPFPSGTKMLFAQAAAPTGWTKLTTVNDAAIRVVSGTTGGGTGGSVAFSTLFATGKAVSLSGSVGATTLTVDTMPSHTHSRRHSYGEGNSAATWYTYHTDGGEHNGVYVGGSGSHTHSLSGTATISLNVRYVDVILCQKD